MNVNVGLLKNSAKLKYGIVSAFRRADNDFYPPFSSRVDLPSYADKIISKAFLVGSWEKSSEEDGVLIPEKLYSLYVGYADKNFEYSFLSYIWVDRALRGRSVGRRMHNIAESFVREKGMRGIRAKTWLENNEATIAFYKSLGYKISAPVYNAELKRSDLDLTLDFYRE